MSIEVIPRDFREPFDPFADVDHESVGQYAKHRIFGGDGIALNLQAEYEVMVRRHPRFLRRLIERGKFHEDVNSDLEYIDEEMTTLKVFNTGAALACTALDCLAYETGVGADDWRNLWTMMPASSDFVAIDDEGELTSDDCRGIGDYLNARGQLAYEQLETPYKALLEEAYARYPALTVNPEVFCSAYGYVARFGQKVIYSFTLEARIDAAVKEMMEGADVDREIIHLVSKRERRNLRREVRAFLKKQSSNSQ